MPNSNLVQIESISVTNLYGLYDYFLKLSDITTEPNQVSILYGENGSGKTTILKLLFHLLACERAQGHKSFIAGVKFGKFRITLSNGDNILAQRVNKLMGSFETIYSHNELETKAVWTADNNFVVRATTPDEDISQNTFLTEVEKLGLSLYLLSDNRTILFSSDGRNRDRSYRRRREEVYVSEIGTEQISPDEISARLLTESIDNAFDWFRRQVVKFSRQGESDANALYTSILKKLVQPHKTDPIEKQIDRDSLCNKLIEVDKKSDQFQKFGLAPSFKSRELCKYISKANKSQWGTIRHILIPYIESVETKFNAIQEIQTQIGTLVNSFNSFLTNKDVTFNIANGFHIRSVNGEELEPKMLSSGERHLFLLFCNSITSLDKQSIFIIDEPEISLNIKWQRKLISSLLECSSNSSVQYIFASHSVEIISKHLNRVIKLEKNLYGDLS